MNRKGFTLVELMAALLIGGILVVSMFPMLLSSYRRLEEEKTRTLAMQTCNHVYRLVEERVKTAGREEIEEVLRGQAEESEIAMIINEENYDLEQNVQISIDEVGDGFLSLEVSVLSDDGEIVYEKEGVILCLNMTLEGDTDE